MEKGYVSRSSDMLLIKKASPLGTEVSGISLRALSNGTTSFFY